MRSQIRWLIVGVVSYIAISVSAKWPTVAAAAEGEEDVKAVVKALEAHYHTARTLKAVFLERYSEGPHEARVESGTVYFSRPGRMRWEYEAPENKLFIADGKTVWFYVPADRTVSRVPMKESSDWRSPLALLTGKAKVSRFCSRIELAGAPAAEPDHVLLRCRPRGEPAPRRNNSAGTAGARREDGETIHEVFLEVDPATGELADVRVRQAGGIEIEYRFGDWQMNIPLPASLFEFKAPIGVAIVSESSLRNSSH